MNMIFEQSTRHLSTMLILEDRRGTKRLASSIFSARRQTSFKVNSQISHTCNTVSISTRNPNADVALIGYHCSIWRMSVKQPLVFGKWSHFFTFDWLGCECHIVSHIANNIILRHHTQVFVTNFSKHSTSGSAHYCPQNR